MVFVSDSLHHLFIVSPRVVVFFLFPIVFLFVVHEFTSYY
jgi:hypothetical protein